MWNWIKLPKIASLVAFVLPWMTVSCNGARLAEATGFQLAFGNITTMGPVSGNDGQINAWLIAAMVVIVVGLVAALSKVRGRAAVVLATSVAALVLIQAGVSRYSKDALVAAAREHGGDHAGMIGDAALSVFQIDWHLGYYLCVTALIVSGVIAALVMTKRGGRS